MGVPGLWDILRPAGKQRSLAQLAVHDGFERNPGGRRGLRVGIDASIWFFHATYGREGENPELRTLFFRCARLMSRPFLPLFVFDGPQRPEQKRKKKVSGKEHWMVSGMQEIIEAFGFEWWCAPGEAEAELAYLNRIGVIDAIITDDVDTFLFGATTIIRNPGKMLSGNSAHPVRNSANKDDGEHTYTYSSSDILNHPDIGLGQDGLILIALLRGGDYDPEGVDGCGTGVAHALARCGFGEKLLDAARELPRARLQAFLEGWRNEIRAELRSNSRGFLNTKKQKLAKDLPDTFPSIDVLLLYLRPVTSERKNVRPQLLWDREPDLMKLAALCERKFEWGVREIIVKRFRTVMWAPVILRIMRRAVLDSDAAGPSTPKKKRVNGKESAPGTPSKMITERFSSLSVRDEDDSQRLIVGIHGKRYHASTDGMPEYRLEIAPTQLVRLTAAGVQGFRTLPSQYRDENDGEYDEYIDDEDEDGRTRKTKKAGPKKPPPEPDSHLRVWIPACIVERVEPAMVAAYEGRVADKERAKEEKAARRAARAAGAATPKSKTRVRASARTTAPKRTAIKRTGQEEEEEEELSADEDFSHVFGLSDKGKATVVSQPKPRSRGLQKLAMSIREEEEETEEEEEEMPASPLRDGFRSKPVPLGEATNGKLSCGSKPATSSRARLESDRPEASSSRGPATGLAKQKSILDLLDERRPSSRVAPSMVSITSPVKSGSQTTRQAALKPFPMSLEDRDDSESARIPAPERSDTRKGTARQFSTLKSDSDESSRSLLASPKKSPRKSKKHSSPSNRSQPPQSKSVLERNILDDVETITESESDRPVSPSPLRHEKSVSGLKVLLKPIASTRKTPYTSTSAPTMLKSSGTSSLPRIKLAQTEVIEITSSSESEREATRTLAKAKPKKVMETASMIVPPGKEQRRVDSIFPVRKALPVVSQKTLSSKAGLDPKRRRPPILGVDEVIEIL